MTNPPVPATPLDVEACSLCGRQLTWNESDTLKAWVCHNCPGTPSEVVDVEACVRLLDECAQEFEHLSEAAIAYGLPVEAKRCKRNLTLLSALASALPGMGKDSERWRAFTAQHSLAHHYSWDGKPNSQLIILENGFISLDDVADRLRAARAAQPEETSRKGWIGCSTRLHASGERTDRGSEP